MAASRPPVPSITTISGMFAVAPSDSASLSWHAAAWAAAVLAVLFQPTMTDLTVYRLEPGTNGVRRVRLAPGLRPGWPDNRERLARAPPASTSVPARISYRPMLLLLLLN